MIAQRTELMCVLARVRLWAARGTCCHERSRADGGVTLMKSVSAPQVLL